MKLKKITYPTFGALKKKGLNSVIIASPIAHIEINLLDSLKQKVVAVYVGPGFPVVERKIFPFTETGYENAKHHFEEQTREYFENLLNQWIEF